MSPQPSSPQPPSVLNLTAAEVTRLVLEGGKRLIGLSFDRAIVPDRPEFPSGFLKSEWSLRFRSRSDEAFLLISLRSQNVFFSVSPGKGPRAAEKATRSGFDLALNKVLDGLKLASVEQVKDDRVVTFWFSDSTNPRRYGLVLLLFPALPEALLVEPDSSEGGRFRILARTRGEDGEFLEYPAPAPVPVGPPKTRAAVLPPDLGNWPAVVESHRLREAFQSRRALISRELKARVKLSEKRLAQLDTAEREAAREPDYARWGDLLKASIGQNPPLDEKGFRKAFDWETNAEISIACDPKLSLKDQIVKFYDLSKRKGRRLSEAKSRRQEFDSRLEKLALLQRELVRTERAGLTPAQALGELEKIEEALGLKASSETTRETKAVLGWEGKVFQSQEGFPILVGRSKDENLELTFKFARGNDLWFHVRGKRGAHVVVPLRSKRTASLETLLDAACLAIYYSGGESWGKTEVDYTQKKHIKRIKDSTEVSYSQNKTLLVAVDAERMKRLKPDPV